MRSSASFLQIPCPSRLIGASYLSLTMIAVRLLLLLSLPSILHSQQQQQQQQQQQEAHQEREICDASDDDDQTCTNAQEVGQHVNNT